MDLKKIKRLRRVEVEVSSSEKDEKFYLDYIPRRWNAAFVEGHNTLLEEENVETQFPERGRERYIYTLSKVVEEWDITQDGERVPVSEAFLREIDDLYLYAMYNAVRQDLEVRETAKNS
jgi:hypothetical protein